ncbi:MAG: phosphopyruvate hydratase [Candidatus Woykebacteria bacterium RBG_13_40_15]|uniref:Enolase n=1 Tax=Candidatus Woykebacteria bacterium RBG_13_40_15 TaxID=1802593 RepID=A0A1G1W748_9BACT|nr:MAG: phosphopyruvate hydratase [Candidatus Woykebacteria bacterium RBG_13_40_15]
MSVIEKISSEEILDSRGIPTLKTTVTLSNGIIGEACVPGGTSTGTNEALELRDGDPNRFNGNGVLKAVENVVGPIQSSLKGTDSDDQEKIDRTMISLDGTPNKSKLGANAILSVSLAVAVSTAANQKLQLFEYLRGLTKISTGFAVPTPMVNLIEGGKHANSGLDFQEFLVIPTGFMTAKEKLNAVGEVISKLEVSLKRNGLDGKLGQEGGFAARFTSNEKAIDFLKKVLEETFKASFFSIGIDVAASTFYQNGKYKITDIENPLVANDLLDFYKKLQESYNIFSFEDLFEEDFDSWKLAKQKLSPASILIADDFTVTNVDLLRKIIADDSIDGVIVKPNQIGTLTETLDFIEEAIENKLKIIISHRAGETMDTFISDLAVAVNADFLKAGCPLQKERLAKYNRLAEIESYLENKQ